MKLARLALVVVLAVAFLAGCGSSPIVGSWQAGNSQASAISGLTFNKDKTGTMEFSQAMARAIAMARARHGQPSSSAVGMPFAWELKDKTLTVTPKDSTLGGTTQSFTVEFPDSTTMVMKDNTYQKTLTFTKSQ